MRMSDEEYQRYLTGQQRVVIKEAQFQKQLRAAALTAGFLHYHTYNSKRSEPGFPDSVMVRGPDLIFAELKVPGGTTSPAQRLWLDALRQVERVAVYEWVPDDFAEISSVLFGS